MTQRWNWTCYFFLQQWALVISKCPVSPPSCITLHVTHSSSHFASPSPFAFLTFFFPFPLPLCLCLLWLSKSLSLSLFLSLSFSLSLYLHRQTDWKGKIAHTHTHTQEVGIYDIEIIFHHLTMLPLFQSTYIWIDLQNERISGNKPLLTSRDKHNHVAGTVFKSRTCHSEVTKSIWIYYASELFFLHENQSTLVTLQHTSHQIILGLTLFA